MNWKNKAWQYATALVVVFILLNPEMLGLAVFIDAIGLDMFLLLVEIQIFTLTGAFLNSLFKPVVTLIQNNPLFSMMKYYRMKLVEEPERLMHLVPSQATLMSLLVFSAAITVVHNTCL